MNAEKIYQFLQQISVECGQKKHRRMVVISDTSEKIDKLANVIFEQNQAECFFKESLFYGEFNANIEKSVKGNYQHHLGTENHLVVYQEQDFHPDAFCALTGTIVAGGLLIVLRSCESKDSEKKSGFDLRFDQFLAKDVYSVLTFNSVDEFYSASEAVNISQRLISQLDTCATSEQANVVKQLVGEFESKQSTVVSLTANRGRGKSTALALALATFLLKSKNKQIILTAPHQRCLSIFYKHLFLLLPNALRKGNELSIAGNVVRFLPIDLIIKEKSVADLVIVDEAAGIPLYLLRTILKQYKRSVFSSTVHGYEGAGRGFSIKFLDEIDDSIYTGLVLKQPVRWADNDPLEKLTFDLFMLNAKLPDVTSDDVCLAQITYQQKNTIELIESNQLETVYALLVGAHYQTKPSDLKLMMNEPNITFMIALQGNVVIGAAMLLAEHKVSLLDVEAVRKSQRQLKGCFIAQSLFRHCSFANAFNYAYLRVVRITVHPMLQSLGIGTELLKETVKIAKLQEYDFVGTTFGCTAPLIDFWSKNELLPVRIGVTKDKASGEHSIMMLRALSSSAKAFLTEARVYFSKSFVHMLTDVYRELDPVIVANVIHLSKDLKCFNTTLHDNVSVKAFVKGERQYHTASYSLRSWLLAYLSNTQDNEAGLLVSKLLQEQSIEALKTSFEITGKKQLDNRLVTDVAIRFNLP